MNTLFALTAFISLVLIPIFFLLWIIDRMKKRNGNKKLIICGICLSVPIFSFIGFYMTQTPEQRAEAKAQGREATRKEKETLEATTPTPIATVTATPITTQSPTPTATPTVTPKSTSLPTVNPTVKPKPTSTPTTTSQPVVQKYDSLQQFFIDFEGGRPDVLESECAERGIYFRRETLNEERNLSVTYTLWLDPEIENEHFVNADTLTVKYDSEADGRKILEFFYRIHEDWSVKNEREFSAAHIFDHDIPGSGWIDGKMTDYKDFYADITYYTLKVGGTSLSERVKKYDTAEEAMDALLANKAKLEQLAKEKKEKQKNWSMIQP